MTGIIPAYTWNIGSVGQTGRELGVGFVQAKVSSTAEAVEKGILCEHFLPDVRLHRSTQKQL